MTFQKDIHSFIPGFIIATLGPSYGLKSGPSALMNKTSVWAIRPELRPTPQWGEELETVPPDALAWLAAMSLSSRASIKETVPNHQSLFHSSDHLAPYFSRKRRSFVQSKKLLNSKPKEMVNTNSGIENGKAHEPSELPMLAEDMANNTAFLEGYMHKENNLTGEVSATLPYIDPSTPKKIIAYKGTTAILPCFVNNLGNKWVSGNSVTNCI